MEVGGVTCFTVHMGTYLLALFQSQQHGGDNEKKLEDLKRAFLVRKDRELDQVQGDLQVGRERVSALILILAWEPMWDFIRLS